jgi:hypothetical protein
MEELTKAKGVPNEWIRQAGLSACSINHLTNVHLWTEILSIQQSFPSPMASKESPMATQSTFNTDQVTMTRTNGIAAHLM